MAAGEPLGLLNLEPLVQLGHPLVVYVLSPFTTSGTVGPYHNVTPAMEADKSTIDLGSLSARIGEYAWEIASMFVSTRPHVFAHSSLTHAQVRRELCAFSFTLFSFGGDMAFIHSSDSVLAHAHFV